MKALYIIAATVILASCKQEEVKAPDQPKIVYMRIESVSSDGVVVYSPVTAVTIK